MHFILDFFRSNIAVLDRKAKRRQGIPRQYSTLDKAIYTIKLTENQYFRYWIDNRDVAKLTLYPCLD